MKQKGPKVDIPHASKVGFKPNPLLNQKLKAAIILLAIIFGISYILSSIMSSGSGIKAGNVAIIEIRNAITVDEQSYLQKATISSEVIELIDAADANPGVKAVIFDINSGGGSAVASDEIQARIEGLNKTTVALVRDIAASGAYWVASAADIIVANRLSIVGNVGVMGSYVELEGLLDKYNMTYRRIVAGEYKDMGSMLKEATPKEQQMLQSLVDEMHHIFINSVRENRNLTPEQVERVRTAEVFTGQTAKELGLVDVLGSRQDAIDIIEENLGIKAQPVEYKKQKSFWERVRGMFYPGSITLDAGSGVGIRA